MNTHNIPKKLHAEFICWMELGDHFDDDMSDGAWFAYLENAAQNFMDEHKIKGDSNEAVHFYLKTVNEK